MADPNAAFGLLIVFAVVIGLVALMFRGNNKPSDD
jgi:hypothetical protein